MFRSSISSVSFVSHLAHPKHPHTQGSRPICVFAREGCAYGYVKKFACKKYETRESIKDHLVQLTPECCEKIAAYGRAGPNVVPLRTGTSGTRDPGFSFQPNVRARSTLKYFVYLKIVYAENYETRGIGTGSQHVYFSRTSWQIASA